MTNPTENFKINLNQNLWGGVVGYLCLGISEHYNLNTLYWFSVILSFVMTASLVITTYKYTRAYKNKF